MAAAKQKVVVLISGSGSNLQALLNACSQPPLDSQAEIVGVLSNQPDAYGLVRAANAGVPTALIHHADFATRESFDAALTETIEKFQADWVLLAGFMRILTDAFVNRYQGRLINIHPSLLPEYPGLKTHQRVLASDEQWHGASVHFVIPELDAGPVIVQGKLRVVTGESAEQLAARVLEVEHRIYPLALQWLVEGRIQYLEGRILLNNEPLPVTGCQMDYTNSSDLPTPAPANKLQKVND